MTQIHRSALGARPAPLMYSLVNDVASYPHRFDWCEGAQVIAQDAVMQVARLDVRMSGLRTSFTTRNQLHPHERIEMGLVDGPFRALTGSWRFTPLGEAGSKVERDGYTLIPLALYWKNGKVKLDLALAKGKQAHDKRRDIAERTAKREVERTVGRRVKGM